VVLQKSRNLVRHERTNNDINVPIAKKHSYSEIRRAAISQNEKYLSFGSKKAIQYDN